MRDGKRSEPSVLTRAVMEELEDRLLRSPLKTKHALAKAAPSVSRSQIYNLFDLKTVIDVEELAALCAALGITPPEVVAAAQERPIYREAQEQAQAAADLDERRRRRTFPAPVQEAAREDDE